MSSDTLIFSESPLVPNIAAEVVVENDCSYLYLYEKNFEENSLNTILTCWIKNHVLVPDSYSPKDDMQDGLQPKAYTKNCKYVDDLVLLQEDDLEIVWGEEGYTVALYDRGELICAIPYWATQDKPGYSKYSGNDNLSDFPFPLNAPDSNAMYERMEKAKTFWARDFQKVWADYNDGYMGELEKKFGKHIKYFAIDGGNFPPKGLAVFEKDAYNYAFTIGLGMFVQPMAEIYNAKQSEKIELAFCYKSALAFDGMQALKNISSIAGIPWVYKTFLDHYHTVDFVIKAEYNAAVLVSEQKACLANVDFLKQQSVNLLWIVPVPDSICKKVRAETPDYSEIEVMIKSKKLRLVEV